MARRSSRSADRPSLDAAALDRLALHYVGRFATTRGRLEAYLRRKLAERGAGAGADAAATADRMVALGYVDDAAWARARAEALARRGYGGRRIAAALAAAHVDDADRPPPAGLADDLGSALSLARRKRIGPYAAVRAEGRARTRALAALARAGHGYEVARRVVDAAPGASIGEDD